MLTNKKTGIRVLALILALMMTVAIFAGCSDSAAREEAEKAKADAAAAQAAAEAAKKAAEEAAKNLQEQLDAAKKEAEEAKKKAEEAQQAANNAGNKADDYHKDDGNDKDPVIDNEFNELTETIKKDALSRFEALKNQYLVLQRTWYTTDNFAKLQKVFGDASIDLYRATSAEGIESILADVTANAAAVDSVVSDAKAVQDKIVALGDVTKTVVIDADRRNTAVEDARAAFNAWANKYALCFFVANGIPAAYVEYDNGIFKGLNFGKDQENIVPLTMFLASFAANVTKQIYINVDETTNGLLRAEKQVEVLRNKADETFKDMFATYLDINEYDSYAERYGTAAEFIERLERNSGSVSKEDMKSLMYVAKYAEKSADNYGKCKDNAAAIEEAYLNYKLFINANGGSSDALAGTYKEGENEFTLTADEFVKVYVLCLYDGQLNAFKQDLSNFLNTTVVEFFMNSNNTNAITATAAKKLLIHSNYAVKPGTSELTDTLNTPLTVKVDNDYIFVYNEAGDVVVKVKFDKVGFEFVLKNVASSYNSNIFGYKYSTDFKGTKTLAGAYRVVEQEVVKAVSAMTQVYFDEVVVSVMESLAEFHDIYIDVLYAELKSVDADVFASAHAIMEAALAEFKSVKVPTYDELNAKSDMTAKPLFKVEKDAATNSVYDHVTVVSADKSSLGVVMSAYADAVENALRDYYASEMLIEEAVEFVRVKKAIIDNVNTLACIPAGTYKASDHENALKVAGGYWDTATNEGLTTTKIADFAKAIKAAADKIIANVKAVTYLDENNAPKYSDYVDTVTSKYSVAPTTVTGKVITYTRKQSRLTVAVDDLIAASTADLNTELLNAYSGLVKSTLKTNVTNAVELYKKQYSFDNLDLVGVNLKNDMVEMADYLSNVAGLYDADAAKAFYDKYGTKLFAVDNFNIDRAKTYYVIEDTSELKTGSKTYDVGYCSNVVVTDKSFTFVAAGSAVDTFELYVSGGSVAVADIVKNQDEYKNFVRKHADLVGTYSLTTFTTLGTGNVHNYYNAQAEKDINRLITIGKNDSSNVFEYLEAAKDLLYMKDSLINSTGKVDKDGNVIYTPVKISGTDFAPVNIVYNRYTGNALPGYTFEENTLRANLYLKRLAEAKDRVVALIAGVNIITSDLDNDVAQAKLVEIMNNLTATTPAYTVATTGAFSGECVDDYSFSIAYARFYETPSKYSWPKYEGKLQPND